MRRTWTILLTLTGAMAAVLALVTVATAGMSERAQQPALTQPAETEPYWWRSYGDGVYEYYPEAMDATVDGGMIVAGRWHDPQDAQAGDLWLAKIDAAGEVEWQRRYDAGETEWLNGHVVQQTSDGGYIVAAYLSLTSSNAYPGWLLKLDTSGNIVWQRTFAFGQHEPSMVPSALREVSGGGFIVVADEPWVARLDEAGNVLWQHLYFENENTFMVPQHVVEVEGGDFIIVGHHADEDLYYRAWAMRLDAAGNVLWSRRFVTGWLLNVEAADDGHFLAVGGGSFQGTNGTLVVKFDANGIPLWQKIYSGLDGSYAWTLERTPAGDYLMGGASTTTGAGQLLKIDAAGTVVWQRTIEDIEYPYMDLTPAGDVALVGVDPVFVKTDQHGNIPGCSQMAEMPLAVTTTTPISSDVPLTIQIPELAMTDTTAVPQDTSATSSLVCSGDFYTISGRVTAAEETPLAGVVLSSTVGITATVDASGAYTFTNLLSGTYAVTPTLSGYTFLPLSRTVSVPPDQAGVDFMARPLTYTVSGRVATPGGEPLTGVTLSSTAGVSATTEASGTYTFTNLLSGTHALTPTMAGFTFSPESRAVTGPPDQAGVDFTARPLSYTVSGRVTAGGEPLAGVILSGTAGVTATTNVSGDYALTGLLDGTYTITPALSGYTFEPAGRTVSVPPDRDGQDFSGWREEPRWNLYLPIANRRE